MADKNYKKNILITGAAGFLGSHFVDHFIKNGHKVYAVDLNNIKLNKLKKRIDSEKLYIFKANITSTHQIKSLKKILEKNKINIDIIINNAAIDAIPISINKKNINHETKSLQKDINVSVVGSNIVINFFLEHLKKSRNGKIINIGSDLSLVAPNQEIYNGIFNNYIKPLSYSVTKHAMLGLTKYYASLFAKKKITVNMLSPGPIFNNQNSKFILRLKKIIPMKRLGNPSDLFSTLDFLISENSNFITGQNILVDGGRTVI